MIPFFPSPIEDTKEGISESTSHEVEASEELLNVTVSFKVSLLTELLVHMTKMSLSACTILGGWHGSL